MIRLKIREGLNRKIMTNESLKKHLEKLYELLETENAALINDEGEKMEAIVESKQELAKAFEAYDLEEINQEDEETISLIKKTRNLQETNLVLTKQAMSYTDTFISAFQKEAQKNITYSEKGNKKEDGSSGLLNRSL